MEDTRGKKKKGKERIDQSNKESAQTRCLKVDYILDETPPQRCRPHHRHGKLAMSNPCIHILFTALFLYRTVPIPVPWLPVFGGRVGTLFQDGHSDQDEHLIHSPINMTRKISVCYLNTWEALQSS